MESYLYLAVVLLLASAINGRVIEDLDNSIQSSKNNDEKRYEYHDWVEVNLAPPAKRILEFGGSTELECQVNGSPQPTVHWIHGNNPRNIIDTEANMITETNPNSFIQATSRIIIDHSSTPERTFTCVGRAGSKMLYQSATVFSVPGHKPHNITELLSLNSGATKARIVLFYTTVFDTIGSNIILPCKTAGRPNAEIYWIDPDENIVTGRDHRVRVHPSGALYITPLRWTDMGRYTCVAKNALGKDTITTFVYPLATDNSEK